MPLRDKPPSCQGCPAYNWGVGFVPPEGDPKSRVVFLGQGPGESEAFSSRPFHPEAPSGYRLTQWIYRAHAQRSEVLIGNIVQCWLPERKGKGGLAYGNREPTRAEAESCWQRHVGPWLTGWREQWPPEENNLWVLGVGMPAIRWLLQLPWKKAAEKYVGTLTRRGLPSWQPSKPPSAPSPDPAQPSPSTSTTGSS